MGFPVLFRALVLLLCGTGAVWTEHYHPNEEEDFYSLYNQPASPTQFKHQSSRSEEPITSIPSADSLDFESELLSENHELFPDRLLTTNELMSERGSGDRFPPDLQFIDDGDVMTFRDHITAMHSARKTESMANEIQYAHVWSDNHEPSAAHMVTADKAENILSSVKEIIQHNLRESNMGFSRRQVSPERQILWLNTAPQYTLEFQEQLSAVQKPLFLIPGLYSLQQHLAVVMIPGRHGQPGILLPLDKSFTELLSQSVIAGPVPVRQRPYPHQQHQLYQQREEVSSVSPENSESISSFHANSPSDDLHDKAFHDQPADNKQFEDEEGSSVVIVNARTSDEQIPLAENLPNNPEFLFENLMTNKESGSDFDESEFLDAVEEIHFVPLGSDVPLTVPPTTKSLLYDQLQRAKVVVAPSNQKNGNHFPIITAIPSVVASSHKVKQRGKPLNDYTSLQTPDVSASANPPEFYTIDESSFSSGSFGEQAALSEPDHLTHSAIHRQKRQLERFLQAAQRSFTAGDKDAMPSTSRPALRSQTYKQTAYLESEQGIPLTDASLRIARQDSPLEMQESAKVLVDVDGNREIRMHRAKPPPDQRPTAWIKHGYATGSFSAVNQEKPPLIHSPNGKKKFPSRSTTRARSKQSPLMMALLPQHLMHPMPIPAPPQQGSPCRPQPLLPAQQEKSDEILATAQSQAPRERPQRAVPRQDQWQQAGRLLPAKHSRQQARQHKGWESNSQRQEEYPSLQDPQHFLPHQIGSQVKGSQASQGSKESQETKTRMMQSRLSFAVPPQNKIPSVTNIHLSQPKRVSPSDFRPPSPDLASLTMVDSAFRSKSSVLPSTNIVTSRENYHSTNSQFRWH